MDAIVCRATGLVFEAKPQTHSIGPGETLADIARAAHLSAEELAAFNCGSKDPEVIAGYLRTTLGGAGLDAALQKGAILVPKLLRGKADEPRQLELRFWRSWFNARLHFVTPGSMEFDDDRFTLTSGDGSYVCTQTVQDDADDHTTFLDLDFYGLIPGKTYALEIDPGAEGKPYKLFEGVSFDDLLSGKVGADADADES